MLVKKQLLCRGIRWIAKLIDDREKVSANLAAQGMELRGWYNLICCSTKSDRCNLISRCWTYCLDGIQYRLRRWTEGLSHGWGSVVGSGAAGRRARKCPAFVLALHRQSGEQNTRERPWRMSMEPIQPTSSAQPAISKANWGGPGTSMSISWWQVQQLREASITPPPHWAAAGRPKTRRP